MPLGGPYKAYIARAVAVIGLTSVVVVTLNITHGHLHGLILDASTVLAAIIAIWAILGTPSPSPTPVSKDYEDSLAKLKMAISRKENQQRRRLLDSARIPAQARLKAADFLHSHHTGAAPRRVDWGAA